jgi:hypothetical protein
MRGAIPALPNMSSWRDAQLSAGTALPLHIIGLLPQEIMCLNTNTHIIFRSRSKGRRYITHLKSVYQFIFHCIPFISFSKVKVR